MHEKYNSRYINKKKPISIFLVFTPNFTKIELQKDSTIL